jgi:hypothetical protein
MMQGELMLNTTRSRVRALAVVGMAAVVTTIGAVAYQASAAEVAAPSAAAVPAVLPAAPGVAGARAVSIPAIPAEIKPPEHSRPIGAYVVAAGTQNYTCAGGVFPTTSTPEAQLIGTGGWIHHFGGPSWQSERDQSLVVGGAKVAVTKTGTIPWLLVTVAHHTGAGILAQADYINRLYTSGGVAPTRTCTDGEVVKVKYSAVYVFWDDPATPPVA